MSAFHRESSRGAGPWALAGASGCSVFVFTFILAVAAFVTRDAAGPVTELGSAVDPVAVSDSLLQTEPALVPSAALVDGGVVAPTKPALSEGALLQAAVGIEPALRTCFAEARARDPSAGRRATLEIEVERSLRGPIAASVQPSVVPSPFFRPCMTREVRKVPAGLAKVGRGKVRATFAAGSVSFEVVAP